VLLVAQITELEWGIKPLIEQWAEVASYDAPGVGDEPPSNDAGMDALVARALAEIDRRGWDRCVVAGDEFTSAVAIHVAEARPDVVQGLALGHAVLGFGDDGEDAPIAGSVLAAFMQLLETDYRSWVRAYTQITRGAYDDDTMEEFLARVPAATARRIGVALGTLRDDRSLEGILRRANVPLLFAEHRGCLLFTPEGFRAATEAFPAAQTVSTVEKPNCSPEFAAALRSFCESL
jgi:pimeloyl-ACP methyl ester carboxylesterase